MADLYPFIFEGARAMIFVDGENLAIRYGAAAPTNTTPAPASTTSWHLPGVALWNQGLNHRPNFTSPGTRVIRKYYYTSVVGDDEKLWSVTEWLKQREFEAPRVFKRIKDRRSKQVDISLTIDMLLHASRKHYDIAILVAGDGDYVPLVKAVKAEGARVHVWFVSNGLNPELRREADHFVDLDGYFGI